MKLISYYEVEIAPFRYFIGADHCDTKTTQAIWLQLQNFDKGWKFIINPIASVPCIIYWDSKKCVYVHFEFWTKGMGFVGLQPARMMKCW